MNVSLTPELEALINEKVASGRYTSASEVVREALRLMEAREERALALRAALVHGIESGEPQALDLDKIRAEAKERAKSLGK